MPLPDRPRVAVLGGGVVGLSSAAQLARRGADVVLVSEGALASGASGRSLSWLNSFGAGRSDAYHRLRMAGLDRYRTFAARVAGAGDYLRFDGGLSWVSPQHVDSRREAFGHMRRIGYDAEWLGRAEVPRWAPGVDPDAVPDDGAILTPGEGWVDLAHLAHLAQHLAGELVAAGGQVLTDAGPATPLVKGGRVVAVSSPRAGRLDVDAAVLATGADTPRLAATVGVDIPDATSLALLVRTEPLPTGTEAAALRAVLNTPDVSLRPAPGGGLVMDSHDTAEQVVEHADGSFEVKDATVQTLLHEASAVLAGHPELRLHSYGVGRKPVPGDGDPVLGELDHVAALWVAFAHSGATLGLVAGELLALEVLTGRPSPLLDAFRPGRFT